MVVMFSRLWDLDDDASDKFEDIKGFPIGVIEQAQLGVVLRGFSLVERVRAPGVQWMRDKERGHLNM